MVSRPRVPSTEIDDFLPTRSRHITGTPLPRSLPPPPLSHPHPIHRLTQSGVANDQGGALFVSTTGDASFDGKLEFIGNEAVRTAINYTRLLYICAVVLRT